MRSKTELVPAGLQFETAFEAHQGRRMRRFGSALLLWLSCGAAMALPFQNGSFEAGGVAPCNTFNIPVGSTLITGWTVSVGNIDWLGAPPACGWQASQGIASLDMVGSGAGGIGGIQQTFDTVPGQTYVVSFDLAGNFGAPPVIKPLAVTVNGVTTNFTFDTTGATAINMGWVTHTVQFTATATSTTINFVSDIGPSGGTLNAGAALDNVRITTLAAGSTRRCSARLGALGGDPPADGGRNHGLRKAKPHAQVIGDGWDGAANAPAVAGFLPWYQRRTSSPLRRIVTL